MSAARIFTIDSRYEVLPGYVPKFHEGLVKNEPMLFNCDLAHARTLGGPLTDTVISFLPDEWVNVPLVVDSRVHMLMPGWYPCIPGWHHDDVPRTRDDKQPNYGEGQDRSEHIVCLINGDICPTAFAVGNVDFTEPDRGKIIYAEWHRRVEALIGSRLRMDYMPSNRLVKFNDRAWHTGTRARQNGWRFFIRFSRYFDKDGAVIARRNARTNEVRRQVQVYLENPNEGW